jgi:hypothetical protein
LSQLRDAIRFRALGFLGGSHLALGLVVQCGDFALSQVQCLTDSRQTISRSRQFVLQIAVGPRDLQHRVRLSVGDALIVHQAERESGATNQRAGCQRESGIGSELPGRAAPPPTPHPHRLFAEHPDLRQICHAIAPSRFTPLLPTPSVRPGREARCKSGAAAACSWPDVSRETLPGAPSPTPHKRRTASPKAPRP